MNMDVDVVCSDPKCKDVKFEAIPLEIQQALHRYVVHKIPTGGFLRAVLASDLFEAFNRADGDNQLFMYMIVKYIYNKLPGSCYGSYAKVDDWLKLREEEEER